MTVAIETTRKAWARAGKFPANKELVYPEHAVIQEFATHMRERVYEYGCGGGADAMSYLRRQNKVWLSDVVPENVEAAMARIKAARLDVARGERQAFGIVLPDTVPIPLAAETMDVVNSHGVVHHIVEPAPVVAEFHRILKRGGACYVMLYTEALWQEHRPVVERLMEARRCQSWEEAFGWCTDGQGVPYARWYTEAEGRALLESAGFEIEWAKTYVKDTFRTFKGRKA